MLKNEHEFTENVRDLAEAMLSTCKCLIDVRYHTKTTSARELFVSIMKILRDAAVFVNTYEKKDWFSEFGPKLCIIKVGFKSCLILEQVVGAQFPMKLEKYVEDLITLKNEFQIAMVMQIAVDAGKIGMCSLFQTRSFVDLSMTRIEDIG